MASLSNDLLPFTPNPALLKKVPEAAYLTAENAHRYRPIMRHFYLQHTAHHYWLSAADIGVHMQAHIDPGYTEEQCEQDLKALVDWGNLFAEQEKSRARTVDEFLRRSLRYQLAPYSVAFERLLTELEQAHGTRGSLDPTLLDALWQRLQSLQHQFTSPVPTDPSTAYLQQVRRWWVEGYESFERIVNDANDYLAAMHRARPDDLARLEAFLAYKDVLLQYLSAFVNELMDFTEKLRGLLTVWAERRWPELLVELLVQYEANHLPGPDGLPDPVVVRRHYQAQVQALSGWFRRGGGVEMLRRVTADAIEMVVRHTQRLVDRRRMGISRRRELEQLARAFAACPTLDQAHRLAGLALGCATPRHLQGSLERFQLGDGASVWAQAPDEVPLTRIQRGGRVRGASAPVLDNRWQQQEVLLAELEHRRREAELWDDLFRDGEVNLGCLHIADPAVRSRLLAVVGACLAAPDRTALASDGSRVQLTEPGAAEPYGELTGPDGVLAAPQLRMRRVREG